MRSIGHILSHRATISRAARSIVNGQVVDSFVTVATGVPCRLTSPSRGGLVVYAGAEEAPRKRVAYFQPLADVRPDDRLTIGTAQFRVLDAEDQGDAVYRYVSLESDLAL